MITPARRPSNSSPPVLKRTKRVRACYVGVRTLQLPAHEIVQTTLDPECYYVTIPRDIFVQDVFFVEICEVYADTVIYRIALQPLFANMMMETMKATLQGVEKKISEIKTSASGDKYFQAQDKL